MTEEVTCWQMRTAAVEADVRRWRAAHPTATLAEIETKLDAALRPARAGLLAEVAADTPDDDRCPECGDRLVRRGEQTRTLRTQGEAPVALRRPYLTCPACGTGLFPPR